MTPCTLNPCPGSIADTEKMSMERVFRWNIIEYYFHFVKEKIHALLFTNGVNEAAVNFPED
jgi:hypothetical protein